MDKMEYKRSIWFTSFAIKNFIKGFTNVKILRNISLLYLITKSNLRLSSNIVSFKRKIKIILINGCI